MKPRENSLLPKLKLAWFRSVGVKMQIQSSGSPSFLVDKIYSSDAVMISELLYKLWDLLPKVVAQNGIGIIKLLSPWYQIVNWIDNQVII